MHNLHYVVVEAESGKEACDKAMEAIESYGDENNWRVACGAVAATGVTYSAGKGGRWDDAECLNLENIQQTVRRWLRDDPEDHYYKTFLKVIQLVNLGKPVEGLDWYCVKKYAEFKSSQRWATDSHKITADQFDVFKHEFRSWNLDECGVTHINTLTDVAPENQWCVLIDMHS